MKMVSGFSGTETQRYELIWKGIMRKCFLQNLQETWMGGAEEGKYSKSGG